MGEKTQTLVGRGPGMGGMPNRFAEAEHADHVMATLVRLVKYFAKERFMVIAMLAVVIGRTLCGIAGPSLQSRAIDIIAGERTGNFTATLSAMLGIYLLYSAGHLAQGVISAHLSQRIVRKMREELFEKLMGLPIRYMDTHSHGDVMSRMTNDIENISNTISSSLSSLFSGVLTVIGTVSIMFWYCWQLALLSFTTVILTLIVTKVLSGRVRRYSRERQKLLGKLNGTVEEMISGYHTVVAYNHQEITLREFKDTADTLTKAGVRTDAFSGVMGPIMNCVSNIGFVIIAAFGGYFSLTGLISVGVISAFIVYARQFSHPINNLASVYGQMQTAIAGAERVFAVLDEKNEYAGGEDIRPAKTITLEFRNVNFAYVQGNPVIRDFSLTVPAGKKIALVGATGSGKTTIVNLLMRFYDIDSGQILVNDQDIREVSRTSLRRQIAIVLQDAALFSDTVYHNLTYANDSAAMEEIEKAAKLSHSKDFIDQLPQGYDTVLTRSGENISQGERQLLTIARTFVADPKILIFDEATSNVDTRTEKVIQTAMQQIMRDRTSIVIAHRLSTIRESDIIVVMDQGRIVETGTHASLLADKGKYYELYRTQYAGMKT
ncbi:MAG: ABC transporter ATP-binding protein/permease [Lachnospiraceae bacterium]|nr:ABC transporter ATP-binding protein/permease [Lachnospiraceae bacterium]